MIISKLRLLPACISVDPSLVITMRDCALWRYMALSVFDRVIDTRNLNRICHGICLEIGIDQAQWALLVRKFAWLTHTRW